MPGTCLKHQTGTVSAARPSSTFSEGTRQSTNHSGPGSKPRSSRFCHAKAQARLCSARPADARRLVQLQTRAGTGGWAGTCTGAVPTTGSTGRRGRGTAQILVMEMMGSYTSSACEWLQADFPRGLF